MMEVGDEQASGLNKHRLEDEGQLQLGGRGIDNSAPSLDLMDVDQCQTVGDMDDSRLLGASDSVPAEGVDCGAAVADGPSPEIDLKVDVEVKMRGEELSLVKRRRGRPPRGQPKATPLPRKSVAKDEEDVCFICFDGGSLVLCDRRGCPKAYHPACIKRDDAFFQSKAKWNCGWHICSSCRKASHYMCYTCTFSLCKGCIKDADYQCVRGSKGLCGTCMRTIMLLEKSLLGNNEVVAQVDFDDKSSWEYLFKIYWVYLKQKLSLTLDELARAKNPWKGGGTMDQNGGFLGNCCDANDSKSGGSDSAIRGTEAANSKTKAFKRQQNFSCEVGFLIENSTDDKMITSTEGKVWATNELLEFVAHMRNGDISELSQLDVESLVLEYIKENNLRDPQQRNQFICDPMLMKLFGKQRLGHFEMLKLLEYHLLSKESSSSADRNSKVLDVPVVQVEVKGSFSCQSITDSDRKHRKRKKADDRKQQTNPDEYAAINVHNINLIYLPRNLIETISGDTENFHDKVVGSIVRMQISRCDQKPDLYSLVQVVGTSKSSEPYAIGEKTTDVMLDILNLDKKEAISLEGISNQEFSEDECWRLRESVKCGLLKRFTVGEIQKKAMTLQALKVNDRLESEILRLNHLHARATEKGYGKELKELVEKLQFLRSSEERQRRLAEIPEIHADPSMDPSYKSDDDTKDVKKTKQGGFKKTCKTASGRRGDGLIYHCGGHDISFDSRSRIQNHSANTSEQNISICTADHVDKEGASWPTDTMLESSWFGSKSPSVPKNHGNPTSLTINNGSNQAVVSEVSLPPLSNRIEHLTNDTDMEKMWHYQDPAGNVQGPFSMAQLQKWSSSGHFPLHLRIWKMSEMPTDSILLTDALTAQESKKSLLRYKNQVLSAIGLCSDDGEDQSNDEWSRNLHTNESGSPPDWNRPADVVNSSECQPKSFEQRTANEDSTGTHQSQVHELSISPLSAQPLQFSNQIGEVYRGEKSTSPTLGNQSSRKTIEVEANSGQSCEKRSDSECCSGQSSGQNWKPLPGNATQDSTDGVISFAKSSGQENCDLDFPDVPCPTPKADVGFTGQAAEIKQSASSGVLIQDSVPSWSTGSSLVGGRRQLPDVAGGWGVYSTAPTKASTEERDSSLITASSLKPAEFISDCAATPASVNDQFTHPSPSHPTSNVSDWPEIIEPNEFNSLGDESLSDLLAEVEAMESLSELASSTSIMNCRDDLTHGCKIDCFSSIGRLSPNPEMGKGDALSSTGDGHVQSQSTITDEPLLRLHVFDIDPQMKLAGRSSTSADVDINKKYNDVSTNQWKGGTVLQNLTHFSAALDMDTAENTWRIGSEATWGSADIGWGGLNKGNPSVDWEIRLDSIQEMGSMNSGTSAGNNTTNWYGQPKCSLDLLPSPRDRSNQGRDLDNGRGRSFWNKQPGFGGGNRSGTSRPSPRGQGQRVCKFNESGYCKRGASCSYLHL